MNSSLAGSWLVDRSSSARIRPSVLLVLALALFLIFGIAPVSRASDDRDKEKVNLGVIVTSEESSFVYLKSSLLSITSAAASALAPGSSLSIVVVQLDKQSKYSTKLALDNLVPSLKAVQFLEVELSFSTYLSANQTVPSLLNAAATTLKHSDSLLFLSSRISLEASALRNLLAYQKAHVGKSLVLGGKIIADDDTIVQAGFEYALGARKSPTFVQWSFGSDGDDSEKGDIALLHNRFQGLSSRDPRSVSTGIVTADVVTEEFLFVPTSLFESMVGFDSRYHSAYFSAEFCHRAKVEHSAQIGVLPLALGHHNAAHALESENLFHDSVLADAAIFHEHVGKEHLVPGLHERYVLKNLTVLWSMECGAGQVLGFTNEAINFVTALDEKVRVKVRVNNAEECLAELKKIGLTGALRGSLARLMAREMPTEGDVVAVLHRDPGRYSHFIDALGHDDYYFVGRSMFETDSIPEGWSKECSDWRIDEIWVPTLFNVETFANAGVNRSKLSTLPALVDVHHFNADAHSPLHLLPQNSDSSRFIFLSIMKWEPRKAWDLLLGAYFDEFSLSENVTLVIVARMDENAKALYSAFLKNYTEIHHLNTTASLPPVHFVEDILPYQHLPKLYKAADAFVLPSHGEGWGLPIMEAMAMKLPVLGTNWSGTTAFMTEDNSFLIPVAALVNATTKGHKWAMPNQTVLRQSLRVMFANKSLASSKASQARSDVVTKFSKEVVAELIVEKLRRIQPLLAENKHSKAMKKKSEEHLWFRNNNNNNNNQNNNDGNSGAGAGWRRPGFNSAGSGQFHANHVDTQRRAGEFVDDDGQTRYRMKLIEE